MTQLLDLQNAYGQWVEDKDNNQWIVYNKDGERLAELPAKWDEGDVMRAIRLGREFEKKAFEVGKRLAVKNAQATLDLVTAQLQREKAELIAMNEDLGEKLRLRILKDLVEDELNHNGN